MRWIGLIAVALSLVLGVGGVAKRPLADTGTESTSDASAAPVPDEETPLDVVVKRAASAPTQRGTCGNVTPVQPVIVDLSKIEVPKNFVSLNRSGYNYRQPGDPPQIIPDSTGTRKPSHLP